MSLRACDIAFLRETFHNHAVYGSFIEEIAALQWQESNLPLDESSSTDDPCRRIQALAFRLRTCANASAVPMDLKEFLNVSYASVVLQKYVRRFLALRYKNKLWVQKLIREEEQEEEERKTKMEAGLRFLDQMKAETRKSEQDLLKRHRRVVNRNAALIIANFWLKFRHRYRRNVARQRAAKRIWSSWRSFNNRRKLRSVVDAAIAEKRRVKAFEDVFNEHREFAVQFVKQEEEDDLVMIGSTSAPTEQRGRPVVADEFSDSHAKVSTEEDFTLTGEGRLDVSETATMNRDDDDQLANDDEGAFDDENQDDEDEENNSQEAETLDSERQIEEPSFRSFDAQEEDEFAVHRRYSDSDDLGPRNEPQDEEDGETEEAPTYEDEEVEERNNSQEDDEFSNKRRYQDEDDDEFSNSKRYGDEEDDRPTHAEDEDREDNEEQNHDGADEEQEDDEFSSKRRYEDEDDAEFSNAKRYGSDDDDRPRQEDETEERDNADQCDAADDDAQEDEEDHDDDVEEPDFDICQSDGTPRLVVDHSADLSEPPLTSRYRMEVGDSVGISSNRPIGESTSDFRQSIVPPGSEDGDEFAVHRAEEEECVNSEGESEADEEFEARDESNEEMEDHYGADDDFDGRQAQGDEFGADEHGQEEDDVTGSVRLSEAHGCHSDDEQDEARTHEDGLRSDGDDNDGGCDDASDVVLHDFDSDLMATQEVPMASIHATFTPIQITRPNMDHARPKTSDILSKLQQDRLRRLEAFQKEYKTMHGEARDSECTGQKEEEIATHEGDDDDDVEAMLKNYRHSSRVDEHMAMAEEALADEVEETVAKRKKRSVESATVVSATEHKRILDRVHERMTTKRLSDRKFIREVFSVKYDTESSQSRNVPVKEPKKKQSVTPRPADNDVAPSSARSRDEDVIEAWGSDQPLSQRSHEPSEKSDTAARGPSSTVKPRVAKRATGTTKATIMPTKKGISGALPPRSNKAPAESRGSGSASRRDASVAAPKPMRQPKGATLTRDFQLPTKAPVTTRRSLLEDPLSQDSRLRNTYLVDSGERISKEDIRPMISLFAPRNPAAKSDGSSEGHSDHGIRSRSLNFGSTEGEGDFGDVDEPSLWLPFDEDIVVEPLENDDMSSSDEGHLAPVEPVEALIDSAWDSVKFPDVKKSSVTPPKNKGAKQAGSQSSATVAKVRPSSSAGKMSSTAQDKDSKNVPAVPQKSAMYGPLQSLFLAVVDSACVASHHLDEFRAMNDEFASRTVDVPSMSLHSRYMDHFLSFGAHCQPLTAFDSVGFVFADGDSAVDDCNRRYIPPLSLARSLLCGIACSESVVFCLRLDGLLLAFDRLTAQLLSHTYLMLEDVKARTNSLQWSASALAVRTGAFEFVTMDPLSLLPLETFYFDFYTVDWCASPAGQLMFLTNDAEPGVFTLDGHDPFLACTVEDGARIISCANGTVVFDTRVVRLFDESWSVKLRYCPQRGSPIVSAWSLDADRVSVVYFDGFIEVISSTDMSFAFFDSTLPPCIKCGSVGYYAKPSSKTTKYGRSGSVLAHAQISEAHVRTVVPNPSGGEFFVQTSNRPSVRVLKATFSEESVSLSVTEVDSRDVEMSVLLEPWSTSASSDPDASTDDAVSLRQQLHKQAFIACKDVFYCPFPAASLEYADRFSMLRGCLSKLSCVEVDDRSALSYMGADPMSYDDFVLEEPKTKIASLATAAVDECESVSHHVFAMAKASQLERLCQEAHLLHVRRELSAARDNCLALKARAQRRIEELHNVSVVSANRDLSSEVRRSFPMVDLKRRVKLRSIIPSVGSAPLLTPTAICILMKVMIEYLVTFDGRYDFVLDPDKIGIDVESLGVDVPSSLPKMQGAYSMYHPPEALDKAYRSFDEKSITFTIGMILYALFCGEASCTSYKAALDAYCCKHPRTVHSSYSSAPDFRYDLPLDSLPPGAREVVRLCVRISREERATLRDLLRCAWLRRSLSHPSVVFDAEALLKEFTSISQLFDVSHPGDYEPFMTFEYAPSDLQLLHSSFLRRSHQQSLRVHCMNRLLTDGVFLRHFTSSTNPADFIAAFFSFINKVVDTFDSSSFIHLLSFITSILFPTATRRLPDVTKVHTAAAQVAHFHASSLFSLLAHMEGFPTQRSMAIQRLFALLHVLWDSHFNPSQKNATVRTRNSLLGIASFLRQFGSEGRTLLRATNVVHEVIPGLVNLDKDKDTVTVLREVMSLFFDGPFESVTEASPYYAPAFDAFLCGMFSGQGGASDSEALFVMKYFEHAPRPLWRVSLWWLTKFASLPGVGFPFSSPLFPVLLSRIAHHTEVAFWKVVDQATSITVAADCPVSEAVLSKAYIACGSSAVQDVPLRTIVVELLAFLREQQLLHCLMDVLKVATGVLPQLDVASYELLLSACVHVLQSVPDDESAWWTVSTLLLSMSRSSAASLECAVQALSTRDASNRQALERELAKLEGKQSSGRGKRAQEGVAAFLEDCERASAIFFGSSELTLDDAIDA